MKTTQIWISSDHAGVDLKEALCKALSLPGESDLGPSGSTQSVDYPDFAAKLTGQVLGAKKSLGILICGSGIGMSIAANRTPGIRAALCLSTEMARLARSHNDANVLCLGARMLEQSQAIEIAREFIKSSFSEEARHQSRIQKIECLLPAMSVSDPELREIILKEADRQEQGTELIASENVVSLSVQEAQGSILTNKYAEGYPGKRYYGGCQFVDEVEQLAIERVCRLFGAHAANVQPHSGSAANMAVYLSVLNPGDTLMGMSLSHGGHLTHGSPVNFSGKLFRAVHYGLSPTTDQLDYDQIRELAKKERPRLLIAGASSYPRMIDFEIFGQIAREIGALLLVDMAHIAGLVATGHHPSPIGHADFVTSTTHKTLRGPRGGLILSSPDRMKAINSQIFPGIQGGPLMQVIAGKAAAFGEALKPEFAVYSGQIIKNAKALAEGLLAAGFHLVTGGTDNHMMLVDLSRWRDGTLSGKEAEQRLGSIGITVNKNTVPHETRSPFVTSGIRIGTAAVTSRGYKEDDMRRLAKRISEALF